MQTKVEINSPKPTKYYVLFYDQNGQLFARKEFDGEPAKYLPLPQPKKDGRILVKDGKLVTPTDFAVYKLLAVRRTEGLTFDEAIYTEVPEMRRAFDMEGVTVIDHHYDFGPAVLEFFNVLNGLPVAQDAKSGESLPDEPAQEQADGAGTPVADSEGDAAQIKKAS